MSKKILKLNILTQTLEIMYGANIENIWFLLAPKLALGASITFF